MHFRSFGPSNCLHFTIFIFFFAYRASEAGSEFSLFEALRDSIYSEVATLISLNESRPHFLVQFAIVYSIFLQSVSMKCGERSNNIYSLRVQSTCVRSYSTKTVLHFASLIVLEL